MPSLHHKHQASPGLYSLRKQSPTKCWSGVPSKNTRSHHDQFHLFLTDLSISFGSASPPSRSTNFGVDAAILILHSLKDQPLRCCQFLSKMRTLWSVTKQHHYGCLWDWKPPHTCYTIFARAPLNQFSGSHDQCSGATEARVVCICGAISRSVRTNRSVRRVPGARPGKDSASRWLATQWFHSKWWSTFIVSECKNDLTPQTLPPKYYFKFTSNSATTDFDVKKSEFR